MHRDALLRLRTAQRNARFNNKRMTIVRPGGFCVRGHKVWCQLLCEHNSMNTSVQLRTQVSPIV